MSKDISSSFIDSRSDVYGETAPPGPVSGMVDLIIKANFKTHLEGFYILESKDSPHGNPTYSFLINIDGQHALWQMDGHKEITSIYDTNGKRTIEGGAGMRYTLEKRIKILAGPHTIFIGLPGDNYYKKFQVSLESNTVTELPLEPI